MIYSCHFKGFQCISCMIVNILSKIFGKFISFKYIIDNRVDNEFKCKESLFQLPLVNSRENSFGIMFECCASVIKGVFIPGWTQLHTVTDLFSDANSRIFYMFAQKFR